MSSLPTKGAGVLARCVSAEIRARLAARRLTQRDLARGAGFSSHNYVSIRLRDENPFTLDDVEAISDFLGADVEDPHQFIAEAVKRHSDEVRAS